MLDHAPSAAENPDASLEAMPDPSTPGDTDRVVRDDADEYLPEVFYFAGRSKVELSELLQSMFRCLARWIEEYEAYPVARPETRQQGVLLGDEAARQDRLADLIEWLDQRADSFEMVTVILRDARGVVLNAHDALPGNLHLSQEEFDEFQRCLEQYGLPRDLYYPAKLQRVVVEPVERYGGIIRAYRRYSPLLWERRQERPEPALTVPSDEVRRERFLQERIAFLGALLRREAELSEPGRPVDQEAVDLLSKLRAALRHFTGS